MSEATKGLIFTFSAYFIWGIFPLYFKLLAHISAVEILPHRAIWAVPAGFIGVILFKKTKDILPALKNRSMMLKVTAAALLIFINWSIYVYAIVTDQVLQASLGYFISPLVLVALGYLILSERLSRQKQIAIALATLGVIIQAIALGVVPWIGLLLAFTFSLYALIKKQLPLGPTQSFFIETLIMLPPAIIACIWATGQPDAHFLSNSYDTIILILAGPITAIPLIFFAAGVSKIPMATNGLLQFVAPSMIFLIAVFIFHEPTNILKIIGFCAIWSALAIYMSDTFKQSRVYAR